MRRSTLYINRPLHQIFFNDDYKKSELNVFVKLEATKTTCALAVAKNASSIHANHEVNSGDYVKQAIW